MKKIFTIVKNLHTKKNTCGNFFETREKMSKFRIETQMFLNENRAKMFALLQIILFFGAAFVFYSLIVEIIGKIL